MSEARDLADRLDATRRANEHGEALYRRDLTHPDRWPLQRAEEVAAYRAELLAIAEAADALPADDLGTVDRVLAESVVYGARASAARLDTEIELVSISPSMGTVSSMLAVLPRHELITTDHGERYLRRVSSFSPFVDEWRDRLAGAAARGVVPLRRLAEEQVALIDRTIPRLDHLITAAQPVPAELDGDAADRWRAELARRVADDVAPALARLRDTIVEHTLPNALPDDRPGLCHLVGGEETYRSLLWASTSVDTSPDEVHRIGLAQVERLEPEYRELAGPLFGTTDVTEIHRRLRDDPDLRYSSADAIVADATTALERALAVAPRWFNRLPQADCTPQPIEEGPIAFYVAPPPDGTTGGQFFFQTGDPSAWATWDLQVTTFHESIPGHHLQLALARELDEVHPLLEEYLAPAYCEGWGLYTERLADEMGLYTSDLDRVGMLACDSMRACRLVVDTGLHALGWTRQQAIDFMAANSPLSLTHVHDEIDRYIGLPGQACSYMLGRLAIDDARAAAERTLAARFDIRQFHDVVLGTGSVPLDTLRWVVAEWAAEGATGGP